MATHSTTLFQPATLVLQDGTRIEARSFGAHQARVGELVFTTGMVGYPQSLTDPSYRGQIMVCTYPIIGSYGVPDKSAWESDEIQASAIIVSTYHYEPSSAYSTQPLHEWLQAQNVCGLEVVDTRLLAIKLRDGGAQLAKIVFDTQDEQRLEWDDPNLRNMVAEVSPKQVEYYGKNGAKTIVYIDCGGKREILYNFLRRGVRVIRVPWNYDIFSLPEKFDGVFVSNGPGDPKIVKETIKTIQKVIAAKIPTFGICLGNQLLALAAGGDTYKLKFGHRSQNQPCVMSGTKRCYMTTQNHGFAVGKVPAGFETWFVNANDQTCEGIKHKKLPIFSVQFHPESTPGPEDTTWLFDEFISHI